MTTRSPRRLAAAAAAVAALLVAGFWSRPARPDVPGAGTPVLAPVSVAAPEVVETHVLRRGETLSEVLSAGRLAASELPGLLLALREHRSPRRMREGTEVTVRRWSRDRSVRRVDLRLNADSTIRLEPGPLGGWVGDVVETPVALDTVRAAGEILAGQSLYQSFLELDDPRVPVGDRIDLVVRLARIFEYRLDFLHDVRPGDRYRLAYERDTRPDGSARGHRILVAEFENGGRLFEAFRFETGDGVDFYDRDGRSLRTAFKRYPLDFVRVTSNFSWRRYHPVLGIYRAHVGTDFGAATGTPVYATGSGVVVHAGRRGGYGNLVILRHPGGFTTRYAHLSRFAPALSAGRRVAQGEVIGYVGATGTVTASHLHYEFRKDGRPVDPRTVSLPAAEPVPDSRRSAFAALVLGRQRLLEDSARAPDPAPLPVMLGAAAGR